MSSSTHTATHEWDTLGDTISHMASLPNAAPGVQQGFKDGYVDARDVYAELGADQWTALTRILNDYIDGIRREQRVGGHFTDEGANAYVAALLSVITLADASNPLRRSQDAL